MTSRQSLLLTNCVALSGSPSLSGFQFPLLEEGTQEITNITAVGRYGCGASGHLVLALFGCIYHHVCRWAEFILACEAFEDLSLETSCHMSCVALEFCPCPQPGVNLKHEGKSHHFFPLSRHLRTYLEEFGLPPNEFRPPQFWLERAKTFWWDRAGHTLLSCFCQGQQGIPQALPTVSLSLLSVRLKRTSVDCPLMRTKREPLLWFGPFAFQMGN